jgi:hypothetical protein
VITTWLGLSNGSFLSTALTNAGTAWSIAGVGDFNGDGRDDILWRSDNGVITDWLGQADGSFEGNSDNAFYQLSTSWSVAGTGDFNGDGRDDILWRHESGVIANWLGQANGGFASNITAPAPSGWSVANIGDFNGDGRDDILWRNANGDFTNWLGQADGSFADNSTNAYHPIATNWHVQPVPDVWG